MGNSWLNMFNTVLLMMGRRKLIRVSGDSMTPTYQEGVLLIMDTNYYNKKLPVKGDVIVLSHPFQQERPLIKRIDGIEEDGQLFVVGDNPSSSTDSRAFGSIPMKLVQGKVVKGGYNPFILRYLGGFHE